MLVTCPNVSPLFARASALVASSLSASVSSTTLRSCFPGNEVSVQLVKGVAEAGNGSYEMISQVSEIATKVVRQLNRAMQPCITKVLLSKLPSHRSQVTMKVMDDAKTEIKVRAPYRMGPVFEDCPVSIYTFFEEGHVPKRVTVDLQGFLDAKDFHQKWELDCINTDDDFQEKLAAKALLEDIEHESSFLPEGKTAQKEFAVKTSLQYGVMCPWTAFVAVEERDGEVTQSAMKTVDVTPPQTLTSMNYSAPTSMNVILSATNDSQSSGCCGGGGGGYSSGPASSPPPRYNPVEESNNNQPLGAKSLILAIIAMQRANGSFPIDAVVSHVSPVLTL